jgi:hypothetical protein
VIFSEADTVEQMVQDVLAGTLGGSEETYP